MSISELKRSMQERVGRRKKRSRLKPVFKTKRLRVFRVSGVLPTDTNLERDVYIAFQTDLERILIAVNAVLLCGSESWFIDWLEVASEYRREGFATEFLDGLREFLDDNVDLSVGSGDSDDFRAFMESYCPDRDE